ncbi:MAG: dephospho-CoA kinase [Bacteroidetes bacterium GWE2_29_8]|nr:MAG: dephospho-CoA kinase [Bacteroidetes bacterium GWE2_29_8]
MLKIGITGGIGSGKTTVCEIFKIINIPVYNADFEAKKLLENENIKHLIVSNFEENIIDKHNEIDRKKLASIVFNDKNKLQQLNQIIHPEVKIHFLNWIKEIDNTQKYIIFESAIIFESGFNNIIDKTILVTSSLDEKIKRIELRDKSNKKDIVSRMKNQTNDDDLKKICDYIISNNSKNLIIPQVLKIHEKLILI